MSRVLTLINKQLDMILSLSRILDVVIERQGRLHSEIADLKAKIDRAQIVAEGYDRRQGT